MNALLLCASLLSGHIFCHREEPLSGYASRYDPNLMEATVELRQSYWPTSTTRGLPPDTSAWAGFVAAQSCDEIGYTYLIRSKHGEKVWRPFLVADCAGHQSTVDWMNANTILVEFGYVEARKMGFFEVEGAMGIEVIVLPRGRYDPPPRNLMTYRCEGDRPLC